MESRPPFELLNPDAGGPVVVSVPHSGRDYEAGWAARLRPPVEKIVSLEDRFSDLLTSELRAPTLIARAARLYIDLNRHEAEIDPGLVDGAVASRLILSPKVRNGLGLVPRRLAGVGELWRGRLTLAEVGARIAAVHRPYHQALAALLRRSLHRHGTAVLLDLHSMPSLPAAADPPASIIIGNRFGQSADAWTTSRIAGLCLRWGLSWRENTPYAGGHIVERHGSPARGVHAVQVEIDRSLYLDKAGDRPCPNKLGQMQAFVRELVAELDAGALGTAQPLAAE
jgi:N-formylglutamate amidohydrolase